MPTQTQSEIRFLRELQTQAAKKALVETEDTQEQARIYFDMLRPFDQPPVQFQLLDAARIVDTVALHRNLSAFLRTTVIGGLVSRAEQHTEVFLVKAPADIRMVPYGSAVLVSGNVVLTAAHLAATFRTAPHLLGFESQTLGGESLQLLARYPTVPGAPPRAKWEQAGFVPSTHQNDLAVGILDQETDARPIPILTRETVRNLLQNPPSEGAQWRIVGFGETGNQPIGTRNHTRGNDLSGWICDPQSQADHGCFPAEEIFVRSNDLAEGEVDSCFGDSGGALHLWHEESWRLAGLVSRRNIVSAQCGPGTPCVFLGAYRDFIDRAIGNLGGQAATWI